MFKCLTIKVAQGDSGRQIEPMLVSMFLLLFDIRLFIVVVFLSESSLNCLLSRVCCFGCNQYRIDILPVHTNTL